MLNPIDRLQELGSKVRDRKKSRALFALLDDEQKDTLVREDAASKLLNLQLRKKALGDRALWAGSAGMESSVMGGGALAAAMLAGGTPPAHAVDLAGMTTMLGITAVSVAGEWGIDKKIERAQGYTHGLARGGQLEDKMAFPPDGSAPVPRSIDEQVARYESRTGAMRVPSTRVQALMTEQQLAEARKRGLVEPTSREVDDRKLAAVGLEGAISKPEPAKEPTVAKSVNEMTGVATNLGNFVGRDKSVGDIVKMSMSRSMRMIDPNGKPILETEKALIAPASPLLSDDKRRERIEAMVEHAAKKFEGKPLRLDGNEKFVSTAIDVALARGVAVEVPAKYRDLLIKKERERSVPTHSSEIDGVITPSAATPEASRVTGRLKGVSDEADGKRTLTITRAGHDIALSVDAKQFDAEKTREMVGKAVRYEPQAGDVPARLVGLTKERAAQKQQGSAIELQV